MMSLSSDPPSPPLATARRIKRGVLAHACPRARRRPAKLLPALGTRLFFSLFKSVCRIARWIRPFRRCSWVSPRPLSRGAGAGAAGASAAPRAQRPPHSSLVLLPPHHRSLKYTFLLLLLLLLSLLLALRLRHCNGDMHRVPAPPRAKMANTTPKWRKRPMPIHRE